LNEWDHRLGLQRTVRDFVFAPDQGAPIAWLYRNAEILERDQREDGSVHLRVGIDPDDLARFERRLGEDWALQGTAR
jgi:hypothetical protein